jgi:deoxyadenosine/deoxycytidine kinase
VTRPKLAKRIFVSHAHADKQLVDALVDLIGNGVGIPADEIFCTALEGLGIPSGTNFIDYIKAQIQKPEVVLLLITENYLKRPFCLAEMGAAWAMSHKIIPLVGGAIGPSDVGGVLGSTQILKLADIAGLNQFFHELVNNLGIKNSNFPRWEAKRHQFMEFLNQYWSGANSAAATRPQSGGDRADAHHQIEGIWRADFRFTDGIDYCEVIEIQRAEDDDFVGHVIPSMDNCSHSAAVDHKRPLRIRGRLDDADLLTGMWYHTTRPLTHGAFQLKVSREEDSLLGGWLMYSDSMQIAVSERWQWQRHKVGSASRFGVYGVTGAGKTTICQIIQQEVDDCRFFSESSVIDDYMRRFRGESLEEFKMRSEAGRMEERQKAFRFHAERIRNSTGVFLGDAHYSFPSGRLGALTHPHPDSRNGIQPVMPEAAWDIYQAIIYLDTPADVVMKRLIKQAQDTGRNTWATKLAEREVRDWIEYEKEMLSSQCSRRGKQFFILSGDGAAGEIAARAASFIQLFKPSAY